MLKSVVSYSLVYHDRQKGTGPIAVTIDPKSDWVLKEIRLHLKTVGGATENFTVDVESISGEEFNVNLITEAMAATSDFVYVPDSESVHSFVEGDKVNFTYANTNNVKWGLEVIYAME